MSDVGDICVEDAKESGWLLRKQLGRGGFGIVSLWENTLNNRRIAVKICQDKVVKSISKRYQERWVQEVNIMGRLSHPNVVQGIETPEELAETFLKLSTLPVLCMEFCSGGNLREVLWKPENCCGLVEIEIRNLVQDLKEAVKYLHSLRIVHRDLKPENVVSQHQPDDSVVYKLIDLGYAKERDHTSLCSSFVGTLQYLAPELYTQQYTCSVDYWSLGLVVHEIVTGFRPFLPNLTPVQWMEKVEKKSSNDICIYQNAEGEIIYSQEVAQENHISQPLRYALEKWLQLALEWDGSKRGHSPDGKLIIFSVLEDALTKKVVSVFCTEAFCLCEYEVDESTQARTVRQWIERDTGKSASNLLLPSGELLADSTLVHPFCDINNQVAMLYALPADGLALPEGQPRLPPLVSHLLHFSTDTYPYHWALKVHASAVFYVQDLIHRYSTFLEAYAVKMLWLIREVELLSSGWVQSQKEAVTAFAHHSFFLQSLNFDTPRASYNIYLENCVNKWKEGESRLTAKRNQLAEVCEVLETEIEASKSNFANLQQFGEPGEMFKDPLDKILNSSLKCFVVFRKTDKEERNGSFDCTKMAKILFLLLKVRAEMLADKKFSQHLELLRQSELKVKCLARSLASHRQELRSLQRQLTNQQVERQQDMWEAIRLARLGNSNQGSAYLNQNETLNEYLEIDTNYKKMTRPHFSATSKLYPTEVDSDLEISQEDLESLERKILENNYESSDSS